MIEEKIARQTRLVRLSIYKFSVYLKEKKMDFFQTRLERGELKHVKGVNVMFPSTCFFPKQRDSLHLLLYLWTTGRGERILHQALSIAIITTIVWSCFQIITAIAWN